MTPSTSPPPGDHRLLARLRAPIEHFLHLEASGGIVLVLAAIVALVWASSPWSESYSAIWAHRLAIRVGSFELGSSVHFVVDEGLMTLFFFVVGLEIKREIHGGELSEWRRAVVPIVAAIGGMIAPALLYFAFNRHPPERAGWGIPMATDIAFAVGVLALLGRRVPPALRVLLLALAIIDDIGAIIVIAIFYSTGLSFIGLAVAGAGLTIVLLLRSASVRSPYFYILPGILVWIGTLKAGIHPTIAGVVLGLLTPAVLDKTALRSEERPAERLGAALHPWVAFGIMPLFALANAGVAIRASTLRFDDGIWVPLGITLGLVVGKPLGILAATGIVTKLRLATLPKGIGLRQLVVLGCVAGIGFTMSIFVSGLAFPGSSRLEVAKLAVLVASVSAGLVAFVAGRLLLPESSPS